MGSTSADCEFRTLLLVLILNINLSLYFTSADKILFIYPGSTGSESHMILPLALELAQRGHQVTFISPIKLPSKVENFTEISPLPAPSVEDLYGKSDDILHARRHYKNIFHWLLTFRMFYVFERCHQVYRDAKFQEIYKESFDLIFLNGNINNCFEGLIYKFKAPFIVVQSTPFSGDLFHLPGFQMPSSFVPLSIAEFSDKMTFSQRVMNTLLRWAFILGENSHLSVPAEKIYRQYLGQDYPSMVEIEKNVSLVFSNSHFAVTFPRVLTAEIIEIGGLHCREPYPLPKELEEFVSGAEHGFIYFSMGSMFKESSFPKELRNAFIRVFSKLRQRILWKTEDEAVHLTNKNISSNVMLQNWFPQQDVLGHKNIRLFISHGGIQSYFEAAYHAVPVVLIPILGDQAMNGEHVKKSGHGIRLEILDLDEESLDAAVRKVLFDPIYKQTAVQLSRELKEQSETPLEKAIYWTNYVLRRKGSPALRSAARDLNIIQYNSFDVFAFLFSILVLFLILFIKLVIMLYDFSKKFQLNSLSSGIILEKVLILRSTLPYHLIYPIIFYLIIHMLG